MNKLLSEIQALFVKYNYDISNLSLDNNLGLLSVIASRQSSGDARQKVEQTNRESSKAYPFEIPCAIWLSR